LASPVEQRTRITSGRSSRPLVFLATSLVALTAASASNAGPPRLAAAPTQELVTLLRTHVARSQPATHAPALRSVPGHAPLTGIRTVLPVIARAGSWLKVLLPGRPNGHAGWISRVATVRSTDTWRLVVDLSRRQVTVYRGGRFVRVFSAVIGKPSTPTPTGTFFVEESIALRPGDVGAPFALALSARSNVLQEFDGGPGQIALHGLMNVGGVLGTAVSHGCVRLGNGAIRWLVSRVGPGAPVTITR